MVPWLGRDPAREDDSPLVWVPRPRIDATDTRIDQLACVLYGLTGDEIRIVEEATHS
jgi:hypothetical protein